MEDEININHEGYKIVKCPHCGKEVTDIIGIHDKCSYCGGFLDDEISELPNSESNIQTKTKHKKEKSILKVIMALLLICLLFSVWNDINHYKQLVTLQTNIEDLTTDHELLQDDYDELYDEHQELLKKYINVDGELKKYKDQQATIDDLNNKLTELHGQYDSLEADRNNLQAQVDAKKAEQERIAKEQEQQRIAQEQASASSGTVYWVAGGSVYHSTPDCPTLKRSSNIMSGSISESGKERGCKVCH